MAVSSPNFSSHTVPNAGKYQVITADISCGSDGPDSGMRAAPEAAVRTEAADEEEGGIVASEEEHHHSVGPSSLR